jgi:hypothetical protein
MDMPETRALAFTQMAIETLKELLCQTREGDAFAVRPKNEMFSRPDMPAGGNLSVAHLE